MVLPRCWAQRMRPRARGHRIAPNKPTPQRGIVRHVDSHSAFEPERIGPGSLRRESRAASVPSGSRSRYVVAAESVLFGLSCFSRSPRPPLCPHATANKHSRVLMACFCCPATSVRRSRLFRPRLFRLRPCSVQTNLSRGRCVRTSGHRDRRRPMCRRTDRRRSAPGP